MAPEKEIQKRRRLTTELLEKNKINIHEDLDEPLPPHVKTLRDALLQKREKKETKTIWGLERADVAKQIKEALNQRDMHAEIDWQNAYQLAIFQKFYDPHTFHSLDAPLGEIKIENNCQWNAAHVVRDLPEGEELSIPKPDIYFVFPIHHNVEKTPWFQVENTYAAQEHRNFHWNRLSILVKNGVCCNPRKSLTRPTDRYMTCFPWAVVELKRNKKSLQNRCNLQLANATATCLDMLNNLSVLEDRPDLSHIPPVVGFTFVGKVAKLWIAYLFGSGKTPVGKRLQCVWEGDLESPDIINDFTYILENLLYWGCRHFKPWLSDLLSRKHRYLEEAQIERGVLERDSSISKHQNPDKEVLAPFEPEESVLEDSNGEEKEEEEEEEEEEEDDDNDAEEDEEEQEEEKHRAQQQKKENNLKLKSHVSESDLTQYRISRAEGEIVNQDTTTLDPGNDESYQTMLDHHRQSLEDNPWENHVADTEKQIPMSISTSRRHDSEGPEVISPYYNETKKRRFIAAKPRYKSRASFGSRHDTIKKSSGSSLRRFNFSPPGFQESSVQTDKQGELQSQTTKRFNFLDLDSGKPQQAFREFLSPGSPWKFALPDRTILSQGKNEPLNSDRGKTTQGRDISPEVVGNTLNGVTPPAEAVPKFTPSMYEFKGIEGLPSILVPRLPKRPSPTGPS